MRDTAGYRRFTRVDDVAPTPRGLTASLDGERLRVDVVRADVVRLAISRGGTFDETPTHAVCVDPFAAPVPFELDFDRDGGGVVHLRTAALTVSLHRDPFRLDVHRADGSAVVETAVDADGRPWAYATRDDAFVLRRRCRPGDSFYGLGGRSGRHDLRGRQFVLWNTDILDPHTTAEFTAGLAADDPRSDIRGISFDPLYVSIPLLHHLSDADGTSVGSFVDNGYRGEYDLSRPDEYAIHFSGGQYTEYVFAGPTVPEVLEAYTALTGRTPLPPLWALGFQQCRWFSYTQDAVEALAARHRAESVPCDALWLDIEYMDGYRVFTWDTAAFPDPPAMLARLADDGVRMVSIIDPGVKLDPGYTVYDKALERDLLCRNGDGEVYVGRVWPGDTCFPDFSRDEVRAWWGGLNAAHVGAGFAGIWNDMNEPATGANDPMDMRFDHGRDPHPRFHNQYALLMAMGTAQGLRAARPDRRPFVLSRAGSAGIQRYAANWLGDNQSRWDHLRGGLATSLGMGLSGQPFVGADVGGFEGDCTGELLVRWTQYGALTPFCRNHSSVGTVDQYAWSFGPDVLDRVRAAIVLRYRLMPYLYTCFVRAGETGEPVQRPLVFDHQRDAAVRYLDDQFLLGPDLLVAPVLEPGATGRRVYLPAGDWHDWHTGATVTGPAWLGVDTPMERIPLFARAGAVVPMWPSAPASTMGHHPTELELHLFVPTRSGEYPSTLQEDDGETTAVADGARYRTSFLVTRVGDEVTLRMTVDGHGHPQFARTAFHVVPRGADPRRAWVDGSEVELVGNRIVAPNAGDAQVVSFTV